MTRTLVFLHGVGGSARVWAPQEEAFSPEFRVLCWNAPGYADRPLPEEPTFAAFAAQLMADLDVFGIETATLIGHSFGGMVAQQAVRGSPARVERLVLSGTSAAFGSPDGDFQRKFIADRLGPLDKGLTLADMADGLVEAMIGDGAEPQGVAIAKAEMSRVASETYRASMEMIVAFDLRDALAEIACPTCVIAAEKDRNAPAAMMERLAGRIEGAEFHLIEGAGHLANLEQPAKFNEILASFLRRQHHG